MKPLETTCGRVANEIERLAALHRRYRDGCVHVHVPAGLAEDNRSLDELVPEHLPTSAAALEAAARNLFFSLPVAFDPAESIGPYLATADRDADGQPYRFLDMGALIATQAFGENDPAVVEAVLDSAACTRHRATRTPSTRPAVSLRLKAELNRIAPAGNAAPLRREHRRRGGRERHQVRAPESRADVGRAGRRLHHLVRRAPSTAARWAAWR